MKRMLILTITDLLFVVSKSVSDQGSAGQSMLFEVFRSVTSNCFAAVLRTVNTGHSSALLVRNKYPIRH
jgi:hypothetical protein